ncbi:hypothetical protein [Muricauda sp. MAR_2010_75]|jgi:hypothetical protein|uniref:hypothetical protein n=1 Tax=Allomuricauda sp. MAR_2010_75 TaxID=1250232 RepID=UPI00068BE0D3|nr:hypothetical protein [Muricauda sp. MAR_2010_75]
MKKIAFTFFLFVLIASCKTKEEKESNGSRSDTSTEMSEEKMETQSPILEIGCYMYEGNGNKISLELTDISNTVHGNLDYALKEKDASTGTFAGTLHDSMLIGSYTFASEGMESTREVAFLVKDDQLIEGYGELDETGTAFKDKSALSFSSSMPLRKTDCDSEL